MLGFRKEYQKITVRQGRYVNGEWVEGEQEQILPLMASIQPLAMDKLAPQLQGRHIHSAIKIYTDDVLNVAGDDFKNGDRVLFNGERYVVVQRSVYQSGVINHYRYQAVRVNNE